MSEEPINLVLVYLPGVLDVEDYKRIAVRVREVAPNISVYIHVDRAPNPALIQRLRNHRTLVFSPIQLQSFLVARGRVYAGRPMLKSEQLLRLETAGVPVPEWTTLDRGKRFDPARWGDFVVVKPEVSSEARGVQIVSTQSLNDGGAAIERYTRGAGYIVQRLVFNPHYGKIRIQTLFDAVLFARLFRFKQPIGFAGGADVASFQHTFSTDTSVAEDFDSQAVFELARRCWRHFDGVAMLGLDVLQDEAGNSYFIEANPGGNTWHISSARRGRMLRARGTFLEKQFGAFELAGEALAKHALEEAI